MGNSNRALTIGFEAHDGCGKTTTVIMMAEYLGGESWHTPTDAPEIKQSRDEILTTFEESSPEMWSHMLSTYDDEAEMIRSKLESMNGGVLILDRTWASFEAEWYARSPKYGRNRPKLSNIWPEHVFQPNVTFNCMIPEEERLLRIHSRASFGRELNQREKKLAEDDVYRHILEEARNKLGCVPLRLRQRSPEVCVRTAMQHLLATSNWPPFSLQINKEGEVELLEIIINNETQFLAGPNL